MQKQPLWTQEFLGMSFSSFFQYMTHYALIAVLPVFVFDNLQGNAWQAGLAMTFFQIGAVLCRPLAGRWIDQFNKRKMLLVSSGLFLLVSVMYLAVRDLKFLLAIRLLHGAVFATGTTTVAAIAALVLPQQRKGEGIGYFAVFSNLAMVVGPFFGLIIIGHYSFNAVFAGCVILAILSFWCGTKNKLSAEISKVAETKKEPPAGNSFVEPQAIPMALMGGLVFFAYAGVLVFSPLYAKQLGFAEYTSAFFAVFALAIVVTRPIVGRVFDQIGASAVIYPGFGLFLFGLFSLSHIQGLPGFLTAGIIVGMGFGALSPAFQTLAIQNSPGQRAGVATATYFLALDISVGLGSFLLSVVAAHAGYRGMYMFAAAVLCVATGLYYVICRQKTVLAE
ncbi:MFS transporter [Sporomusa acidovorans]|uniref:MFS-type transporter YhhS n=1 Tax=Sporomusa acidovorans (strain ATCC 49682 / DSM 3132 / Mol) TaxID=1123286 RepID=A0ABZ3JB34_SPOA4|nr:MFS transporter [Sporomusa acidovorans]OZC13324.1 multidrug resistance protein MdtG [Sporomusa acidovorans DSM 3132]SDD96606.1 Predicted arabinose efflux permease, MFS family [Sporomusa acidovorans]